MRPREFQRTRRRKKCFGSSENLLFYICGIHIAQFHIFNTRALLNTFGGLVRDRFGDQEIRTDLFDISIRQPNSILGVVFGGSVFLAELAEEREDPLRPSVGINNWFQETVTLWTHFELVMFVVPSQLSR